VSLGSWVESNGWSPSTFGAEGWRVYDIGLCDDIVIGTMR
jgi:hypothetical protein